MTKKQRKRKKKLQSLNRHLVKKYYWLEPKRWNGKRDKDYDYTYYNNISYHYYTDEDYLNALQEKQDENAAIDNDL